MKSEYMSLCVVRSLCCSCACCRCCQSHCCGIVVVVVLVVVPLLLSFGCSCVVAGSLVVALF